ncbi:acyl-CoA synthetase [Kineobactrum sediminis]|uniref:Acyl-CoA synthetase n=1 Tax=Kineobactrum sediminis TaxID=1905677 RepID=A0A2N5Y0Y0_9GAMM|nr:fatty acyl-CoA synthetase [Kineobactrum sediminis]PLW82047.1 acyl-CoA synthetase [Kineobactrum sediminis]
MDMHTLSRQTLFDTLHRSARRYPDKIALRQGEKEYSYRDFNDLCLRVAGGLKDLGIQSGDRVAMLSRNSIAFAAVRYAVAATGAILVPVNFMLNIRETRYILEHSGARLLFVGETERDKAIAAARQCPQVQQLVWLPGQDTGNMPDGIIPFDQLCSSDHYTDNAVIETNAPAQIIYTSGTESAPKGAVLSHAAILWQYSSCLIDAEIAGDDTILHALPLFHCAQLDCFLGPALKIGSRNVITDDPSPENLLSLLAGEQVTSFFAPPTVWISLLRSELFEQSDLSHLRKGYYGASIMPVEVMKEIHARLPDIRLWNLYGQTEMAPMATILKPADQLRKAGSAGRPALYVETRIVDDAGTEVATGEIGEVVHRSPQLLTEYFRDPERTAAAFEGGWFHSGDLGVMDSEGYLAIVDRKKDMIKTGGENVSSREVEEVIYQLPEVSEVAVIGLSHPRWMEAVAAVIVPRTGCTVDPETVIHHCTQCLAGFKVPKAVLAADMLPRNPSGKILKRNLREAFADTFITGPDHESRDNNY